MVDEAQKALEEAEALKKVSCYLPLFMPIQASYPTALVQKFQQFLTLLLAFSFMPDRSLLKNLPSTLLQMCEL